jgi:HK97 family phage prohead protease
MAIERASFGLRELKLAPTESKDMTFEGYGAVFGNVDSYGDVIQPGAFAESLAVAAKSEVWPAMLLQHGGWGMGAEDMTPIGIWTSLSEDGVGLKVTGKLADTARGREAYALLKMDPRPAISGLSIGYIPKEWAQRSKPEEPRRTLKKVDLMEVSLVTFPANGKARISAVKSLDEIVSIRDAEAYLRDAGGFSKSEAVALVARIKSAAGRSESDDAAGVPAMDLLQTLHRAVRCTSNN